MSNTLHGNLTEEQEQTFVDSFGVLRSVLREMVHVAYQQGREEGALRAAKEEAEANAIGQRPTSYPVENPAVVGRVAGAICKTCGSDCGGKVCPGLYANAAKPTKLTTEQVIAELHRWSHENPRSSACELIDQLPKPDVVEECEKVRRVVHNDNFALRHDAMRAALRHYRSLGCPEIPE